MTIRDLIDELTDIADEYGDDIEVRLAHQPRWAFEYGIDRVGVATMKDRDRGGDQTVAYIAEKGQIGYLPQVAAVAVGWAEEREDEDDDDE